MNFPDEPMQPMHASDFKSGFIAIAGAPNVGKSTLLNRILGQKISITSRKPQTTRNRILGVINRPKSQMIFIDTPGVHKARELFNTKIVEQALSAFQDADVILALADASAPDPKAEAFLRECLQDLRKPVILALNKIDLIAKPQLLGLIQDWSQAYDFKAVIPISARHGTQVPDLLTIMETCLPQGPPLFPAETLTDLSERFIAAEMIREKVFRLTGQEIPYATAVTVERFSEKKEGRLIHIEAVIHLERDSQKGILIGKGGSKLKQIGEAARKEIERMTGTKVFLKLFVRIQKNWSKDTKALQRLGY